MANRELAISKYNEYCNKTIIEDNCLLPMSESEIKNFTIQTTRKVVNKISHINIDGKALAPFDGHKRILMKDQCIVHADENNNLFVKKANKTFHLKEIKDIIENPLDTKNRTQIQKTLFKQNTYKRTFYQKVKEVNKVIYKLNRKGSDMEPLHFDL